MQLREMELDLVRILQKDARISTEDLGKMLQVPTKKLRKRLKSLKKRIF